MGFLAGKRYLIVGIASDRSIATGIADAMHREGAELAFTYQNDKLKSRVTKVAERCGSSEALCFPCDVTSDEQIQQVFNGLGEQWDGLDGVVHAVGFAPASELDGNFADVATREGFRMAHDISAYSFVALAQAARPMMAGRNGSLLTLTYHASRQTVPNYNVMGLAKASLEASVRYLAASLGPDGIRVNGISAGPIRTLAASGIKKFRTMLDYNAAKAPLRRNVTIEEVGNTAAFLCSDLASGITAEITYVDAGAATVSMPFEEPGE
ncbi:enoyl-ACP reductase [Alcanivorax marinus]|uniref:Enoyl-[acyl-carrier-protein] reductase [NADH] n=1 Tax=Alloalcanivorax marinus TaxID=1177169 RepID=A0A9Q3UND7_9GAMM|nr:enoyl-ACP reductase [Alloalcanivorax marinus]MCC4310152.1 enoyl-ACP reductase [Alloalcanivorax marinus]